VAQVAHVTIELCNCTRRWGQSVGSPPIWRRIAVRADMKLDRLAFAGPKDEQHEEMVTVQVVGQASRLPHRASRPRCQYRGRDALLTGETPAPLPEQLQEMKEWVSGARDATRFSLEQTNAGLKRIKAWRLQVSQRTPSTTVKTRTPPKSYTKYPGIFWFPSNNSGFPSSIRSG
jgi:hypothetical protein